jgi:hypothetical protein
LCLRIILLCRCYARLHPRAVNCRKKKCGHSNQVQYFNYVIVCTCLIAWISHAVIITYSLWIMFLYCSWGQRRRSSKLFWLQEGNFCCRGLLECVLIISFLVLYETCWKLNWQFLSMILFWVWDRLISIMLLFYVMTWFCF